MQTESKTFNTIYEGVMRIVSDPKAPDLTARQLCILMTCHTMGKQTIRSLSQSLNVPKPAMSRGCQRLVDMGLVNRVIDTDDRRSVLITTTEKGDAYLASMVGRA